MTKNAEYTQEYLDIVRALDGDAPGRRAARSFVESSNAELFGKIVTSTYVPRFYDKDTYEAFKYTAETTHGILCKVIQHYLDDPAYREIFDYDPRIAELILLDRGYPDYIPIMRMDVFTNEDTLECGFIEFNSDGTSGMTEDRTMNNSFAGSRAMAEFKSRHDVHPSDLFDALVEELLAIYSRYEKRVDNPRWAMVDYFEQATMGEFREYCRCFAEHGIECSPQDVRDLTYDGKVLRGADGRRIDAIWRRTVSNDLLEHWDESGAYLDAVRDGNVALIGSFAGHIVHDKQIFEALHNPLTHAFLTPEEVEFVKARVPKTCFLDDEFADLDDVRANKDKWIIKPTDHYGSSDVFAGLMYSQEEWNEIVNRYANSAAGEPFLLQTYLYPYRTQQLVPCRDICTYEDADAPFEIAPYGNLNGLYLFNGKFAGVFSRMGPNPVISELRGDPVAATMWVDCD